MSLKEQIAAHKAANAPAPDSLKGRIAAHRAEGADKQARIDELNAQEFNATEGMSTAQKFMSGVGGGMIDVAQGAGNMMGLVDDQTIADKKALDQDLADTTAGSVGQFAGEAVALLPLGGIGGGLAKSVAGKAAPKLAAKAGAMLPKAMQGWGGAAGAAATEGALGGAILANPNERGRGAALGALTGGALSAGGSVVGRTVKDGLVKRSKAADELTDLVEKQTGKRPFIPLNMARDPLAGGVSSKAGSIADVATLIPSARDKMVGQADELMGDLYETNLKQMFGGAQAKAGEKVLKETGDMRMAIEAAKNAKKTPGFTDTQGVLDKATRAASTKGQYTPRQLIRAAEKNAPGDLSYAPMRQTANLMEEVTSRGIGGSNVAARKKFQEGSNIVGRGLDLLPFVQTLGSKPVQNFIMGNTAAQRALKEALATSDGKVVSAVMKDIRRAMSVQPAVQESTGNPMMQQAQALRGAL